MLLTLSGRRFIKIQYSSFPIFPVAHPFRIAMQLQCYVKREKCKVNDVIFPSGCEACAINLKRTRTWKSVFSPQGLETYFNMHKYTELLTYLTKIRISEYKYIQGIELHGGQFAYRPRSNRDFSQSF